MSRQPCRRTAVDCGFAAACLAAMPRGLTWTNGLSPTIGGSDCAKLVAGITRASDANADLRTNLMSVHFRFDCGARQNLEKRDGVPKTAFNPVSPVLPSSCLMAKDKSLPHRLSAKCCKRHESGGFPVV